MPDRSGRLEFAPAVVDPRRGRRDRGGSLIEILIAIVLLGGVVGGTLAMLRTTILSGAVQRDHTKAHAWLQSSSDVLYSTLKKNCDPLETDSAKREKDVRDAYDLIVDSTGNPEDWADWQIKVVAPVQFWNAGQVDADPDVDFYFGPDCDASLELQLIKLEVRAPSGRIIESVEIVK